MQSLLALLQSKGFDIKRPVTTEIPSTTTEIVEIPDFLKVDSNAGKNLVGHDQADQEHFNIVNDSLEDDINEAYEILKENEEYFQEKYKNEKEKVKQQTLDMFTKMEDIFEGEAFYMDGDMPDFESNYENMSL